jgi:bisphosphoglycerate-independent phosphoglycerate mutase (AlkP superfamily)
MMTADERKQLDQNTVMTTEIHSTVTDLRAAIIGNPELGHIGLVGQVKTVNDRQEKHEIDDTKQFQEIRDTAKAIGDKLTKIMYASIGAVAAVKVIGWGWEAFHALK